MAEKHDVKILIDNKDYTGYLADGTLSVEDAIGERSPCSLALIDTSGTLRDLLVPGETVEVLDSGTKVWGGSIETPQSYRTPDGTMFWTIDCVDWHQICDRRVVAETFQSVRAGQIVKNLVHTYLAADGINEPNRCPGFDSWTLANGASIDEMGVLRLPNANSYALSPFIKIDCAANWWFTADYFPENDSGADKLLSSYYYDANYQSVANSAGYASNGWASDSQTGVWTRCTWAYPGGGGPNVVYMKVQILRDATYAPNPYRVRLPVLSIDGTTVDPIQDGPVVVEAVFNYATVTSCLDNLAEKAGFAWWIDPDKRIHFVERSTYLSPWALDDTADIDDLKVSDSRQGYRNRQYIKAGKDLTDPQTESFKGNGSQKTFTVGFPIGKVPSVSVNGVARSIGIKGIDTGKDWYWNKGDPVLTQNESAEPLGTADSLEITYQGLFDVVILTTDEAAIDERKGVEGGSGWYEAVEDEPYLSSREAAIQSGNAKLKRYAKIAKTLSFTTWKHGLRPGQIIVANRPADRLHNEEFLIERVTFSEVGADLYKYQVRAVSGQSLGGWAKFFKNMATRGQAFVIRENIREDQVLIRLVQSQEGWQWTESNTPTVLSCPIPSGGLYPSGTLYPC